jgi:Tfp pilus assembly protein PilO
MGIRLWAVGTAILCIALVALGWLIGVSPRLDQISASRQQQSQVNQQNELSRVRIAQLKADFANLDQVAAELEGLRHALPASADYTGFLEQLNAISGQNSVALSSFIPAAPVVFTATDDPAASASSESSAPGTASSGGSSDLADGTLIAIPVALSATGAYDDLLAFMGDLQGGDRLYLASGFSLTGADDAYSLAVTGNVFVSIDSSVTPPGAAVSEEAPVQTP